MVLLSCFFLLPWGFPARRLCLVWKEPGREKFIWHEIRGKRQFGAKTFAGFLKIFLANWFMNYFGDCVVVVGLFEIGIKWQISNLGGLWAAHNFLSLEKNRRPLPPTPPSTQLKPGQFLFPRSFYYTTLVFPRRNGFVKISAAFPPVSPGRTSGGQKNSGFFFSESTTIAFPFFSFFFSDARTKKIQARRRRLDGGGGERGCCRLRKREEEKDLARDLTRNGKKLLLESTRTYMVKSLYLKGKTLLNAALKRQWRAPFLFFPFQQRIYQFSKKIAVSLYSCRDKVINPNLFLFTFVMYLSILELSNVNPRRLSSFRPLLQSVN